jgi:GAF domain-containing protein
VAELKDNINEMIGNLRDTTREEHRAGLAEDQPRQVHRMLQGQRDLATVGRLLLSELAPLVNAQQGVFYVLDDEDTAPPEAARQLRRTRRDAPPAKRFELGEGWSASARSRQAPHPAHDVPATTSDRPRAWARRAPRNVIVLPVLFEGEVKAVIELASLREFTETHLAFLEQLTESIGIVLNTIEATMRTEGC